MSSRSSHASYRQALSDIKHALSQPLTALQCALEISLLRDVTLEEFKDTISAAIQEADRMRKTLLHLEDGCNG